MTVLRMITVGSPTAVQLAEITMFSNELHEAHDALTKSLLHLGSDPLMARHLVNAGAIAYFRCFMMSDRSKGLHDLIVLTEDLEVVHDDFRTFRNQTVAHIDSGLRRTLVWLGVEDDDGVLAVRAPAEMTIHLDPPKAVVLRFLTLIEASIDLALEQQTHLEAQLVAEHGPSEIAELWARADNDDLVDPSFLEWSPLRKRLSSFVRMSYEVPPPEPEA